MTQLGTRLSSVAAIVALMAVAPAAHAGLIYDNGVAISDIDNGYNVNLNPTGPYYGDDFTLASDTVINEVRWSGIFYPWVSQDDFTLRFYKFDDASGPPLHTIHVGDSVVRTDPEAPPFAPGSSLRFASYRAAISPTLFAAGRYLLSIRSVEGWYWSIAYDQGDGWYTAEPFGFVGPDSFDFKLYGDAAAVPEPSTFLLGALGVACGLGLRRRSAAGRRVR